MMGSCTVMDTVGLIRILTLLANRFRMAIFRLAAWNEADKNDTRAIDDRYCRIEPGSG